MVIGIDPDSKAHGVAYYEDGKLWDLHEYNNVEIINQFLEVYKPESMLFSIEDVCSNNFVYTRNSKFSPKVVQTIARKTGMCQQSQIELINLLDKYKVKYVLHKPQKGNWANNKAQFEKATGWSSRSNKDTRSAAYFGWLECTK